VIRKAKGAWWWRQEEGGRQGLRERESERERVE